MVGDPDLDQVPARDTQLDEQLRGEERPARLDGDPREGLAPEQLAGTVDVADPETEPDEVGDPVRPGVEGSNQRVGPLDPEADDRVRMIGRCESLGQPGEVGHAELAVAIGWGMIAVSVAVNLWGVVMGNALGW